MGPSVCAVAHKPRTANMNWNECKSEHKQWRWFRWQRLILKRNEKWMWRVTCSRPHKEEAKMPQQRDRTMINGCEAARVYADKREFWLKWRHLWAVWRNTKRIQWIAYECVFWYVCDPMADEIRSYSHQLRCIECGTSIDKREAAWNFRSMLHINFV